MDIAYRSPPTQQSGDRNILRRSWKTARMHTYYMYACTVQYGVRSTEYIRPRKAASLVSIIKVHPHQSIIQSIQLLLLRTNTYLPTYLTFLNSCIPNAIIRATMTIPPMTVSPLETPKGSNVDFGVVISGVDLENLTGKSPQYRRYERE